MKHARSFAFLAAALAVGSVSGLPSDARACAVLTPDESIPVKGHKMILSLSNDKTTLWDQFQYEGDPASFAWILPIKGVVEVELSSDAIFDAFGQVTAPQVFAPAVCPNSCLGNGGSDQGGNVTVIAHETVGPFDTVQLSSSDPNALADWLQMNGYPIPAGIAPVLDAHVAEGFDFLAVKLIPGQTTEAIQPLRITMTGASPSIPIRLLAAGTGDLTAVTLWIVSEGKYLPGNAPVLSISEDELVWDFATGSSNYDAVRAQKLAASDGLGYLVEGARQYADFEIRDPLQQLVDADPVQSGYGATPAEAQMALDADMDDLFGTLGTEPWVTRLSADLSREALANDLMLTAAADQSPVYGAYSVQNYVNEEACPPDPCGMGGSGGGGGGEGGNGNGGEGTGANGTGGNGNGGDGSGANGNDGGTSACNCSVPGSSPAEGGALGLVLALGAALRRRLRRRAR
jgi:MYXO-CTERM domain-containing protein